MTTKPTEPTPADKEAARQAQEQAQRQTEFGAQLRSLFHVLTRVLMDARDNDIDVNNLSSAVNLYKAVISKGGDRRPDFVELYEARPDDWASVIDRNDWLEDSDVVIKCLLTKGEKKRLVTVDLGAVFQVIEGLEQDAVIMDNPAASTRALTYRATVLAYLLRIFVNISDESELAALSGPLRHYETAAGLPSYRRAAVSAGPLMDQFLQSARAVAEEYAPKLGITIPKGDFDPSILSEVGAKMMETVTKSGIDVAELQQALQSGDMNEILSKGGQAIGKVDYKKVVADLFPSQPESGEVFDD